MDLIQDEVDRDHASLMQMCEEAPYQRFTTEDKYVHAFRCMEFSDDLAIKFLMAWDVARRAGMDIDVAADHVLNQLRLGER
jgi:hypothetical protein